MKILYAIQGTGNGHITRSSEIIEQLRSSARVDVLVSGIHNEIQLPFPVKYRCQGLGFIFGKTGGINYYQTYRQNNLRTYFTEIHNLPVANYDMVVSDYEPVSVYAAKSAGVPTIGISNQVSVFSPGIPKPRSGPSFSKLIMENYARCEYEIGLHYEKSNLHLETPVIRRQIREGINTDEGFGMVYLPAYSDEIILKLLKGIPELDWIVFSKHSKQSFQDGKIKVVPLNGPLFTEKLLSCHLVITAAGFGTTTEAVFCGKKLLVVPMKNQYEQVFNAYTLRRLGVGVLKRIPAPDAAQMIKEHLYHGKAVHIPYPDNLKQIAQHVFEAYAGPVFNNNAATENTRREINGPFLQPNLNL